MRKLGGNLFCQAWLFLLSGRIFGRRKLSPCWLMAPITMPLQLSPQTQEDAHCPVPLPLPTACFRLILSSPPQHSACCRGNPERTEINGIRSAEGVSWPGLWTSPFLCSLEETQKLMLLMSMATIWFLWPNVTRLFTSASTEFSCSLQTLPSMMFQATQP